jgi:hypothetical protein
MKKEDYPMVLTAKHVSQILGCSLRIAYEVMDYEGFPLLRVGRSKKVSREAFFNWLDQQSQVV